MSFLFTQGKGTGKDEDLAMYWFRFAIFQLLTPQHSHQQSGALVYVLGSLQGQPQNCIPCPSEILCQPDFPWWLLYSLHLFTQAFKSTKEAFTWIRLSSLLGQLIAWLTDWYLLAPLQRLVKSSFTFIVYAALSLLMYMHHWLFSWWPYNVSTSILIHREDIAVHRGRGFSYFQKWNLTEV